MAGEVIQYQTEDGVTVSRAINAPSVVEQHFVEAIGKVKQIEAAKPKTSRKDKGDQT